MKYTQTGDSYILKIEKGEEVLSTLTTFCEEQGIKNGTISGIGAVEWISCGYYALSEKKYYFTQYEGLYEVLSATGNVALKEGKPFIHMHAVFSGEDNNAFGGHVEEVRVGVVLEVILKSFPTSVERELDQDIGLFLMTCGT